MLQLKNIKKVYQGQVEALKGIDLEFRENEFVSILGPSGCGKTTFLNIIGGLDRYTSGDLIINGKSTKEYKDRDWDTYRNHSVGFVFQSYNLIAHQSILSNVELALTLAGIGKKERRERAINALKEVGLGDQIHKKPNQLSGGQMQRVAIARALVGNPDILLADEPTGALDSTTSVQIMDLLKKIAKNRLVIMVTHNPELAEKYSTRIIKLLDGKVIEDSDPYVATEEETKKAKSKIVKAKKTYMKFRTALSLSFKNLLTKKGRTMLTSFAGSIGIIGIALILSLSTGVQDYINKVEEDTLSSYPITIEDESVDMSTMLETMMGELDSSVEELEDGKIYSANIMTDIVSSLSSEVQSNNLKEFKEYLENEDTAINENSNAIQYSYDITLNLYKEEDTLQVNPSQVLNSIGIGDSFDSSSSIMSLFSGSSSMTSTEVWKELLDNSELIQSQYDILAGKYPENYNEVVLIVDENNQISDYTLYALGIKDQSEIEGLFYKIQNGEEIEAQDTETYTYDDFLGLKYKIVLNSDYYAKENGIWVDKSENEEYMASVLEDAEEVEIVGIMRLNEETSTTGTSYGEIGYLKELTEYYIEKTNESEIVKEQLENPDINVFTGNEFTDDESASSLQNLTDEQKMALMSMTEDEQLAYMTAYAENATSSYEDNLEKLGAVDLDDPSGISIYPISFESKDAIKEAIEEYNQKQEEEGHEENKIEYSDLVGTLMTSVTRIINIISYVLIAFVAISLVVSSIMIAIITYISVLERTKEIGVLRSIGASKKDVSRVFNAETLIEGLIAGALGIGVTLLICIPANAIVKSMLGISNIAHLPLSGGIALVVLSVVLTMIAGIIPSRMAAKKDPAEALRTE